MSPRDPDLDRLKEELRRVARAEAPGLLDEAAQEARREAGEILRKLLVEELLQEVSGRASSPSPAETPEPDDQSRPKSPAAEPHAPAPDEKGVYVYAVTSAGQSAPSATETIDGTSRLRTIEGDGTWALVSDVPLDEFGEDELPARLNDLGWLERKVKVHERVVDAARELGPTVPLRFCTIYRDDARVGSLLARHRDELVSALAAVEGRSEWGVKALSEPGLLGGRLSDTDEAIAALRREAEAADPGKSYFLDKKLRDTLATRVEEKLHEICSGAHSRLLDLALDWRRNRHQSKELTGEERAMVMNHSYLVADDDVPSFLGAVSELDRRHASDGVAFEATGPWPPYSFITLDLSDEGEDERTAS